MKLKIIQTGSKGNCYLFKSSSGEILMVECGVVFSKLKKELDFDFSKVVGCILTHEHLDHSKSIKDVLSSGIKVYASQGTHKYKETDKHHNSEVIKPNQKFRVGEFEIIPFEVLHDAAEPMGFLIRHEECGLTLFLTDTYYVRYVFPGLNNIIIETNFCEDIIDKKIRESNGFLRDRILTSHFSIQNAIELLKTNNISDVNNIVLIHLSDSNSNEIDFEKNIKSVTGKNVVVAKNNLEIDFNKTPF